MKISLTYEQVSLVMLPPVTRLFGDVRLLLGFTVTNDKSIPKVCAATWATCSEKKYVSNKTVIVINVLLIIVNLY